MIKRTLFTILTMLSFQVVGCDADGVFHIPVVNEDAFLLALEQGNKATKATNNQPIPFQLEELKTLVKTSNEKELFSQAAREGKKQFCHYHDIEWVCHRVSLY
ncbi:hypothetical protein L4C54_14285 [Vibrio lamellibrachiae]|uniref:hypothetical protein n=1 Tax=Vibrio lamellibrachiae TaxID=2910253 RepID=UPI003D1183C8